MSEFTREFEALRVLRHPHIITLYGACVAPSLDASGYSRHFIVTELATGSLANLILDKKEDISAKKVEKMAMEIASGGAYIHAHHMIHFDIKVSTLVFQLVFFFFVLLITFSPSLNTHAIPFSHH